MGLCWTVSCSENLSVVLRGSCPPFPGSFICPSFWTGDAAMHTVKMETVSQVGWILWREPPSCRRWALVTSLLPKHLGSTAVVALLGANGRLSVSLSLLWGVFCSQRTRLRCLTQGDNLIFRIDAYIRRIFFLYIRDVEPEGQRKALI